MQMLCYACRKYKSKDEVVRGVCDACVDSGAERPPAPEAAPKAATEDAFALEEREAQLASAIILTTSIDVPRREIEEIVGIVATEVAIAQNILKDIGNSLRDLVGGRSGNIQNTLRSARDACLAQLKLDAYRLGADAVIAVDLDYNEASSGNAGGILFVAASGTAVKLASKS